MICKCQMKFCSNVVTLITGPVIFHLKPKTPDGQPLKRYFCKSNMHLANDCPNKGGTQKDSEDIHGHFFSNGVQQCYLDQVVSESLHSILLDFGCSSTNFWKKLAKLLY